MLQMIQEGGGGIWPVITMSIASLVVVVLFVIRPTKARRALVHGCMAMTLGTGCLGSVRGIQSVALDVVAVEQLPQFLVGLGQSLHLLVLAGIVVMLVLLAATVGNYRLAELEDERATDRE